MRTTPLQTAFPGVEVHANIVQGILDQRIMQMPSYSKGLEFLLLILLGAGLTFILPFLSPLHGLSVSLATVLFVIGTNMWAWSNHTVLPIASPIFLTVLIFTLNMTYGFFIESRGKRHLARLFGQYIPPELVAEMSTKTTEINLEGEMREMSVLFSDVRGFTSISENMEPVELTKFINAFLTPITAIIHHERGTIDKYMGDAVMAFWGAPLEDDHHALNAMTAAMKMIKRMEALTGEFEARGWPPIKVGVGVNTGQMNVGNKGSEFRVDYTILGDAVNLGSRLEGLTKNYGVDIIVGETTKHAVPEFEYRELDRVRVKGKLDSVSIYEPICLLIELDDATDKDLRKYHRGLKYYRDQKWDEAEREFLELSSLDKECKIYQIYLDRILEYRETPPEGIWDGSFTHTSK
jgi:adenylate cyclase